MPLSSTLHKSLRSLLCCVFLLPAVFLPKESYAGLYDGVRSDTVYDENRHMCQNDDYNAINFDPFMIKQKTSYFDLSNPVCIGLMSAFGATVASTKLFAWKFGCIPTNPEGLMKVTNEQFIEAGLPITAYPTPFEPVAQTQSASLCFARTSEYIKYASGGPSMAAPATMALSDMARCCSAVVLYNVAVAALISTERLIWDKALITYKNARICGHDWSAWIVDDETKQRVKDKGPYKICLQQLFEGNGKIGSDCEDVLSRASDGGLMEGVALAQQAVGIAKSCLNKSFSASRNTYNDVADNNYDDAADTNSASDVIDTGSDVSTDTTSDVADNASEVTGCYNLELQIPNKVSLENKFYREYIYGGKEYADNGDHGCSNPWSSDHKKRKKFLGYTTDSQRYYMTGAGGAAPAFACHRFFADGINEDTQKAYDCCKNRSQKVTCIENRTGLGKVLGEYKYKFCENGSFCDVADTKFEVYQNLTQNYICAKTYSLCPYNHLLGGGTETKDISSNPLDNGAVNNYCQYLNHCSKLPTVPYVYSSNLNGDWISGACRDLKGDSQNVYNYSTQIVPTNTRHFSAPVAQCFKETMENIFLNKAGSTKCRSASEIPGSNGVCASGYQYKKGDQLVGESFFVKIQNNLQSAIKIGLVISIVVFGYTILMGVPKVDTFNKKALVSYIVKLALVMYFAVGDGWQDGFMKGVLGFSGAMSELAFRLDESGDPATLDGCQFPRFNYADNNEDTRYDGPSYAPGLEYLRIWDTLDCKLVRALGYGPEVSVPNLLFMILGGFLDAGLGLLFVLGSLFLAFFMIAIIFKALHTFLLSTTAIILLLYVSPITITCAMFARTKTIFDQWRKQLIGISLQPMILFAYLGVLIAIFDHAIVGEVRFSGDGKSAPKEIICDNSNVAGVFIVDPLQNGKLNTSGNSTSIYCIFRTASIKTSHGLEVIGIGLPVLMSMTKAKIMTIIKASIIMFIFLQFLDKISAVADKLVGGANIISAMDSSAMIGKMAKGLGGAMRSVQKRGLGAAKNLGKLAIRKGGEMKEGSKEGVRDLASSKKKPADAGGKGSKSSNNKGGGKGGESNNDPGGDHAADSNGKSSLKASPPKPPKFSKKMETITEGDESDDDDSDDKEERDKMPTIAEGDESGDGESGDDEGGDEKGEASEVTNNPVLDGKSSSSKMEVTKSESEALEGPVMSEAPPSSKQDSVQRSESEESVQEAPEAPEADKGGSGAAASSAEGQNESAPQDSDPQDSDPKVKAPESDGGGSAAESSSAEDESNPQDSVPEVKAHESDGGGSAAESSSEKGQDESSSDDESSSGSEEGGNSSGENSGSDSGSSDGGRGDISGKGANNSSSGDSAQNTNTPAKPKKKTRKSVTESTTAAFEASKRSKHQGGSEGPSTLKGTGGPASKQKVAGKITDNTDNNKN